MNQTMFFDAPPYPRPRMPLETGPPRLVERCRSSVSPNPVVSMIFADLAGTSGVISSEFTRLNKLSIVVRSPLEAIQRLESDGFVIDAVFVSLRDRGIDIPALFAFLQEEYPLIRRVAYSRHTPKGTRIAPPIARSVRGIVGLRWRPQRYIAANENRALAS